MRIIQSSLSLSVCDSADRESRRITKQHLAIFECPRNTFRAALITINKMSPLHKIAVAPKCVRIQ